MSSTLTRGFVNAQIKPLKLETCNVGSIHLQTRGGQLAAREPYPALVPF